MSEFSARGGYRRGQHCVKLVSAVKLSLRAVREATTKAKWQVYRRASQRGSKGCRLRAIDRDRRPVPT